MNRLVLLGVPLLLLVTAPAHAADRKFDPDAAAKAVAPFLDDNVLFVGHLDLTRLDAAGVLDWFTKIAKLKPDEITPAKKMLVGLAEGLSKAGVKDVYLVFGMVGESDSLVIVMPLEQGADAKAIAKVMAEAFPQDTFLGVEVIDKAAVVANERDRKRLKTLKPIPRPELAKAFAATGDGVAHAALTGSENLRTQLEKEAPMLPKELGGGPIKVVTRGGQWAALGIAAPPKFKATVVVQAADKDAAQALHALAEKLVKLIGDKVFRDVNPNADLLLQKLQPNLDGDRLTLTIDEELLTSLVLPAVVKVREAAMRSVTMNNLHQLGIAMHAYHNDNNTLPAVANFDKQGKPLLSWRVHLLPYLDEAKLYKEFKLDEPWDSDHNKKLIAKMPKVFANPYNAKLAADGKTTYLLPVHMEAIFTGDKTGIRLTDITDGTSNTVMLVDAADDAAVIWTKPDDLKVDPKDPAKGLGVRPKDIHLVLFADGHVSMLQKTIDKKTLWAIFTRAGGEVVDLP